MATTSHRNTLPSSAIPPIPPDGTNTPQTARIGSVYNGADNFPISPDTPPKDAAERTTNASATPLTATPNYGAPTGGVLASLTLRVIGNEVGNNLFMNLDDASPSGPGTNVDIFTGTGLQNIPIPVTQLGDGFHGEGATCAPQDCVNNECPPVDSDGDGWSDPAETVIGTDPFDACADNAADDAWPADMTNNTFIDTGDIGAVTNHFAEAIPPAPARVNVAPDPPDGFVDTVDIGRITGLFGRSCAGS